MYIQNYQHVDMHVRKGPPCNCICFSYFI